MAHRLNAWARTGDGAHTYKLFKMLLRKGTMQNLWDTHPPFQIDGNFGGTAGVAEMLLQSQEGFIRPLPALPNAWKNGSYHGLCARGGFQIDAQWANHNLRTLTVKATVHGECKIALPTLDNVRLLCEDAPVEFHREQNNILAFQAKAGKCYTISFN